MLRFLGEAQSLCVGAGVLTDRVALLIGPKLPISQRLIQWLYAASDEDLVAKGVTDHKQLIRRANLFINHHKASMQALTTLNSLRISISDIERRVEKFVYLVLPSPFPIDGYILWVEKVRNKIEQLQQDETFLQCLSSPTSVEEVEQLLHPLDQLYALLKFVHEEPKIFPFDEVICLD